MVGKSYNEFDQCPICGDPLKKSNDNRLMCKCCGFNIELETKVEHDDIERLHLAYDALRSYEFNSAASKYALIMDDNDEDKEIYVAALFGKLLSEFGVVYIKDTNGETIPTFSEFNPDIKSIKSSRSYKNLTNLDAEDNIKDPYLEKIEVLDNIYKRIDNELKAKEEYDIFICTKISKKLPSRPNETGFTEDSRMADDFFFDFKAKGLKVFYSDRCCNEIEYDSQILSALLKSKKILIISTAKEYLESPWVQSEWRRWINFVECGVKEKNSMVLYLPYYEKDAFELPRQLRKVQRYTRQIQVSGLITSGASEANKESAKEKDAESLYNLGMNYYKGKGVNKDYAEAVKYLEEAVVMNHHEAEFTLGYCYFNGYGVNKSHQEAFKLYLKAAEGGSVKGMCNLAICYKFGYGVKESASQAAVWFEKAAGLKNYYAQCELAILYRDGLGVKKSLKKEFELLLDAAENGYPFAQYQVGIYYRDGDGFIKENLSEAVKWLNKGAMQNHGDSACTLASLYENGLGVNKSLNKALKYYEDAKKFGLDTIYMDIDSKIVEISTALKKAQDEENRLKVEAKSKEEEKKKSEDLVKNANSNYKKALEFENKKNYQKAMEYYHKAAEGGNARSMYAIGEAYFNAYRGVEKDDKLAFEWFNKAHSAGDLEATNDLAVCYLSGRGVKQNVKKGFKLMKYAADNNFAVSQAWIGSLYSSGTGCFKNYKKSFKYFLKSHKNGYEQASIDVGWYYINGYGVKKDLYKGITLIEKGVEKGDARSKYYLAYCYYYNFYHQVFNVYPSMIQIQNLLIDSAQSGYQPAERALNNWYNMRSADYVLTKKR